MIIDQFQLFTSNRAQIMLAACVARLPSLQSVETVCSSAFSFDILPYSEATMFQVRWENHYHYMRGIFNIDTIYQPVHKDEDKIPMIMTTLLSTLGLTPSQPTRLEISAVP